MLIAFLPYLAFVKSIAFINVCDLFSIIGANKLNSFSLASLNLDKTIPLSMDDVGKSTPCKENCKKRVLKKEKYEKKCRENSYIESNDRNLKGRKNKLARQHRFESNDSEQQNAVETFNLAALQEEMK